MVTSVVYVYPINPADPSDGYGFVRYGEGETGVASWSYERKAEPREIGVTTGGHSIFSEVRPWSQSEATNRATRYASWVGIEGVVQVPEHPAMRVEAPGGYVQKAPQDGHPCTICGINIPLSGGRGRPRKTHAECKAAGKPAYGEAASHKPAFNTNQEVAA